MDEEFPCILDQAIQTGDRWRHRWITAAPAAHVGSPWRALCVSQLGTFSARRSRGSWLVFGHSDDRDDVLIDCRYLDLLFRVVEDPEVEMGVRVGPGARMPRLPALYHMKKSGARQSSPTPPDSLDEPQNSDAAWRRNFAPVAELADKVVEVLDDQSSRCQH